MEASLATLDAPVFPDEARVWLARRTDADLRVLVRELGEELIRRGVVKPQRFTPCLLDRIEAQLLRLRQDREVIHL
jgi:hypothetical protein